MPGSIQPLTARGEHALPLAYRWILANGLRSLAPWHFLTDQARADRLAEEFRREVAAPASSSTADLAPFATRQDRDDVAGFVVDNGAVTERVCVVHLTWAGKSEQAGFPSIALYVDFFDWLTKDALAETRRWMDEAELVDLLSA